MVDNTPVLTKVEEGLDEDYFLTGDGLQSLEDLESLDEETRELLSSIQDNDTDRPAPMCACRGGIASSCTCSADSKMSNEPKTTIQIGQVINTHFAVLPGSSVSEERKQVRKKTAVPSPPLLIGI